MLTNIPCWRICMGHGNILEGGHHNGLWWKDTCVTEAMEREWFPAINAR